MHEYTDTVTTVARIVVTMSEEQAQHTTSVVQPVGNLKIDDILGALIARDLPQATNPFPSKHLHRQTRTGKYTYVNSIRSHVKQSRNTSGKL
jgi:hypothetical protein